MKQLGDADPRRIGPFSLLGRLGSGGMGAVYLGRSAGGRTVAVKVVRPDLAADPAFRSRFRSEVEAARRVSGAFTAPVVEADPEADLPWMATAFVAGVSLHRAVVARGPLPEDALWTLTAGLAEALTSVHAAGLIHRDLKPANVLLALDGPHVIDFGISRAADGAGLTATGAVVGSAPYLSPEQAMGQPLTPASDVFSLGSTIAFAARGSDLFGEGVAAAVAFRVATTEPDLGEVPESLRGLIASCLAKDPDGRPSPRELVAAVERAGRPEPSRGWLPEAVAADIVAVRAVMTRLPEPGPTEELPPATQQFTAATRLLSPPTRELPPPDAPSSGPRSSVSGPAGAGRLLGRRGLLLGLTGGALALAGAGAATYALLGGGSDGDSSGGSGSGSGGSGAGTRRPSAADVREATLAWKTEQSKPVPQVLSAGKLVVCVTRDTVVALDDKGRAQWTVNGAAHGVGAFAMGASPATFAAVAGGRLYVGGMQTVLPITAALLAIDLASGEVAWETTLGSSDDALLMSSFWGVRDGTAYLSLSHSPVSFDFTPGATTSPSTQRRSGQDVVALSLSSRKVLWSAPYDQLPIYGALPSGTGTSLFGTVNGLKAVDAKGRQVWTTDTQPLAVGAGGPYVVVVDAGSGMRALDPATGRAKWSLAGVVGMSARGGGIATDPDGRVVYALLRDGGTKGQQSPYLFSLVAVDSRTGEVRWKKPVPADDDQGARYFGARLLYADGNVYRMGADSVLWAFDPADGEPRWKYTGMKGRDPLNLAWAAGDGRVCVSDVPASTVAMLHANGA